jgi:exodeoxyribonuclease VII large subunit
MPELISDKQVFSLLEVTKSIQKTLSERYRSAFWVKAEMNKLNFYRQSGHCYPELLEKQDGFTTAQVKATLWRDDFFRINNNFQRILKEPLKDGIKILFFATIAFDPVHGLSLNILDIDPSYTLGDLEREKLETIRQLKDEGFYFRNKQLQLPLLPQRIAIISVQTSKGYADFLRVIDGNPWKYKFFHHLFPSLLQGDKAIDSIIAQLRLVQKVKEHFDVVAIIRGGGGDVGLSCYNNYRLAKEIALFPIPVLTGIGHATNETVSEMISFSNAITPTKLAEYLIQKFHDFAFPVQDAERLISDRSKRILNDAQNAFQSELKLFRSVTENILSENRNEIRAFSKTISQQARFIFRNESESLNLFQSRIMRGVNAFCSMSDLELKRLAMDIRKDAQSLLARQSIIAAQLTNRLSFQSNLKLKSSLLELNSIEKNVENMSPSNVLKRGYSITTINGKSVTSAVQVKKDDVIKTTLFDGEIFSNVTSTRESTES